MIAQRARRRWIHDGYTMTKRRRNSKGVYAYLERTSEKEGEERKNRKKKKKEKEKKSNF